MRVPEDAIPVSSVLRTTPGTAPTTNPGLLYVKRGHIPRRPGQTRISVRLMRGIRPSECLLSISTKHYFEGHWR